MQHLFNVTQLITSNKTTVSHSIKTYITPTSSRPMKAHTQKCPKKIDKSQHHAKKREKKYNTMRALQTNRSRKVNEINIAQNCVNPIPVVCFNELTLHNHLHGLSTTVAICYCFTKFFLSCLIFGASMV